MPGLDGAELCRRVRAHPGAPYTYIILLTVLDDEEHTRYGMQAGADDFLRKPLRVEDLEMRLIAAERVSDLHHQLWNQETRREHTHDALLRLTQQVAALSDPHDLQAALLAEATVLLDGSAGLVSTWDDERASLTTVRSTIPESRSETTLEAAQRVSARAIQRRGPAILNGSMQAVRGETASPPALAVPLVHQERVVGALAIVSFAPGKRFLQGFGELTSEHFCQHVHRKEELLLGRDPTRAIRRQSAGGNNTVDMRMMFELLIPTMQHTEEADVCSQMLRIASDLEQCLGADPKE